MSASLALAATMLPFCATTAFADESTAGEQQLVLGAVQSSGQQSISISDEKYTFSCEFPVTATGDIINLDDNLSCFNKDDYSDALFYKTDFVDVGWHSAVRCDNGWELGEALSGTPSASGTYFVKLQGTGRCVGTRFVQVAAYAPNDLCGYQLLSDNGYFNLPYTGHPVIIDFASYTFRDVDFQERHLVEGSEFIFEGWYSSEDEARNKVGRLSSAPAEQGDYFIRIEGAGGYSGFIIEEFSVRAPYDLTDLRHHEELIYDQNSPFVFPQLIEVEGRNGDTFSLKLDADFQVVGWKRFIEKPGHYWEYDSNNTGAPTSAGRYEATLRGKGLFKGDMTLSLILWEDSDIARFERQFDFTSDVFLDGDAVDYQNMLCVPTDIDDNPLLNLGTDYSVGPWHKVILDGGSLVGPAVDGVPTESGRYYLAIKGQGAYKGTAWVQTILYSRNDFEAAAGCGSPLRATITGENVSFTHAEFSTRGISGEPVVWKKGVDFSLDENAWYTTCADARSGKNALAGKPAASGVYFCRATGINGRTGEGVLEIEVTVGAAPSPGGATGAGAGGGAIGGGGSGGGGGAPAPGKPDAPAEPEKPAGPEVPEQPENPGSADEPAVPEAPAVTVNRVTYTVDEATGTASVTINPDATSATVRSSVAIDGKAYKVTTLTSEATKDCSKLRSLTITKGITKIEKGALANCPKLTSLSIGIDVTSVPAKALAKCPKLKALKIYSGKLTKKQLTNLLKGSKVTTITLAGKAAKAKKASYTKWVKAVRGAIKVKNA